MDDPTAVIPLKRLMKYIFGVKHKVHTHYTRNIFMERKQPSTVLYYKKSDLIIA